MKKYINAKLEIIAFDDNDVIVTSGDSKQEKVIVPVKSPELPDEWVVP